MGYYGTYSPASSTISVNDILLIAGFFIVLVDIAVSVAAASIATQKGYKGILYGILCFFTGPVGCIIVAALPDHKMEEILSVQRAANFFLEKISNSLSAQQAHPKSHAPASATASAVSDTAKENSVADDRWVCKHCGATNDNDTTFCLGCGENRE